MTRSATRRGFCLAGGVRSTASSHEGIAGTVGGGGGGGLGTHNQSPTSSMSHMANHSRSNRSKSEVDWDDSAPAGTYFMLGSAGGGCRSSGPTGTTEGAGVEVSQIASRS